MVLPAAAARPPLLASFCKKGARGGNREAVDWGRERTHRAGSSAWGSQGEPAGARALFTSEPKTNLGREVDDGGIVQPHVGHVRAVNVLEELQQRRRGRRGASEEVAAARGRKRRGAAAHASLANLHALLAEEARKRLLLFRRQLAKLEHAARRKRRPDGRHTRHGVAVCRAQAGCVTQETEKQARRRWRQTPDDRRTQELGALQQCVRRSTGKMPRLLCICART